MAVRESVSKGLLAKSRGVGSMTVYPDIGRRQVVFTAKEMGRAQVVVLGLDELDGLIAGLQQMREEF